MKTLSDFKEKDIRVLLTDIDGTLTLDGRLPSETYTYLAKLMDAGIQVIPVTGRPAGWCELIARLWPVHGVVGENGALYFRYDGKKMRRHFARPRTKLAGDHRHLDTIRREVLKKVKGSAVASDQFCRMFDLAIDFAEDVKPLTKEKINKIVDIFHKHGATAKVSNIHVNGWFGKHDKVSTCQVYLEKEFGFSKAQMKNHCAFVGDSPNDEPMFEFLKYSFAVANIREFIDDLKHRPAFITKGSEAAGFIDLAKRLLVLKAR